MPKIENVRLSKVVADRLMEQIIDQSLTVGDRLPTEPQLMEDFGVSRTVIREAATLLVSRGMIDVKPRRGMTVRAPDGQSLAESLSAQLQMSKVSLSQLLHVRLVLETAIVQLAAEERTEGDVSKLHDNLRCMKNVDNNKEETIRLDISFHELIAESTHNPFFMLVCRPIIELLRNLYMNKDEYMSLVEHTYSDHQAVFHAIEMQDAHRAEKEMRRHLGRTEQTIRAMISNSPH